MLNQNLVGTHPFIIGELACGSIKNRHETIAYLRMLPSATVARESEVLHLLESYRLWSRGLGWVDLHLLTAVLISGWNLWTGDTALARTMNAVMGRRSPRA